MSTPAVRILTAAALALLPSALWAAATSTNVATGTKSATSANTTAVASTGTGTNNVLLLIADDLGAERVTGFTEWVDSTTAEVTVPTLSKLAAAGLTFSRTWSYPTCSPTRAALMTGLYSNALGILSPTPTSLPAHLSAKLGSNIALPATFPASVAAGLFGKWHVSTTADDPVACGFDRFLGFVSEDDVTTYTDWTKYDSKDKTSVPHTSDYITTYLVDQATAWIKEQADAGKPWFAEVAFNAPHGTTTDNGKTWHWNASDLSSSCVTIPKTTLSESQIYDLQVQCLDSEMGRLLDQIDTLVLEHTTIIFIGDNGTPGQVAVSPLVDGYAKGTVNQGGVHVPMIIADGQYLVSGATISTKRTGTVVSPGRTVHSLAQVVDLYPTIRDILGGTSVGAINGVSLVPYLKSASSTTTRKVMTTACLQGTQYSEAATDGQFKLIRTGTDPTKRDTWSQSLFNLTTDAWEKTDVLGQPKTDPSYTVLLDTLKTLTYK